MSQNISFNGTVYTIPDVGDDAWGQNLTDYFVAIASGALQKSGGTFTLTANVNFGASFGLLAAYFSTRTASPSTAGLIRLANADSIGWRNAAASGNLLLGVDSSNRLTFNGSPFIPTAALTASRALVSDASGVIAVSAVSSTELAYVSGVTSAIQTQINGKQASGNYITALTGDITAAGPGSVAATLATVNANVGSFGSSTAIPAFTVNAKGLITAASSSAVIAPAGTLTGTALASNVVTSSLTALGTIATGAWQGTPVGAQYGGTGAATLTANNIILGNGTSAVQFVAPSTSGNVLQSNGTTWISAVPAAATYTAPKITTYTSGSGTFTKTGSPLYIRVRMIGGGGGGSGAGTSASAAATDGTASTFGTTLLSAGGGVKGVYGAGGGAGGTSSLGSGPTGTPRTGAAGGAGASTGGTGEGLAGRDGGIGGLLGGAGPGGGYNASAPNATINSGAGGGGGGLDIRANAFAGSGGGAGGVVDAVIASPSSTYPYAVGAPGNGGTGSFSDGGNAGAGYIEVTEYYQ